MTASVTPASLGPEGAQPAARRAGIHQAGTRQARLESLGEGRFRLEGVLDATTVVRILKQGNEQFAGMPAVQIDLSGVTATDSAGLALLIEWLRGARERGQLMRFGQLPEQLSALARISEVEALLSEESRRLPGSGAASFSTP